MALNGNVKTWNGTEWVMTDGSDAIPASEDLHAHYDFSQEDGNMPITDQTGNGFDLTTGSYSGVGKSINGVQAGDFDGVDDYAQVSFSNQAQPNHVFLIFEVEGIDSQINNVSFDGATKNSQGVWIDKPDGTAGNYNTYAGSRIGGQTNADVGDIVLASALFNESNSVFRLNKSQDATGNVGTNALDGITLGASGDGSQPSNYKIGEVLVYPEDKSGIVTDVEQYLADKWGPFSFA